MKKEIETVKGKYVISKDEVLAINNSEEIDRIIKSLLSHQIAGYILKKFRELPVKLHVSRDSLNVYYEIKMNLISDEALKELQETQRLFERFGR